MNDTSPEPEPTTLGDLLRSAAPEGPDPACRAGEVVRRAKRANRRRSLVGVVAVAVVAGAAVGVPQLLGGNSTPKTSTGPTSGVVPVLTCPATGAALPPFVHTHSRMLPAGAVEAHICPRSGAHATPWQPPLESLTTNVDALVEKFNTAPSGVGVRCLALPPVRAFSIALRYPNGSVRRLSGGNTCNSVSIQGGPPSSFRSGASSIFALYFRELQRQRSTETPPAHVAATGLDCPRAGRGPYSLLPVGTQLGLTRAIVCRYDSLRYPKAGVLQQGRLSALQVKQINADYAEHVTSKIPPGAVCLNPDPPDILIIGENAWGDTVELNTDCYVYTPVVRSKPQLYWPPTDATWNMIDRVLR